MSHLQSEIKKYPLLPYSQLVYDMLKTNPDVYWTRFSVRVNKGTVDMARFKNAVEVVLRNHPVFSMRVDDEGRQQYEPLDDIFHGQYHSVDFIEDEMDVRIDVAYNRILGDARSELIMYEDVCRAYEGLQLLPDNYVTYLERTEQEKQSARYAASKEWLKQFFYKLNCPVYPKTDIPLELETCPIEGIWMDDYSDVCGAINLLLKQSILPLTAFFSLASALAMMEFNGTEEAALTWAYEGREHPEEQRVYGSLHRDIPFYIRKSQIENLKSDLIRQARNQIRTGIAHSDYPYTLTKPYTQRWNYALNVLVQPKDEELEKRIPFPIEVVSTKDEQPHSAYALLDVEVHATAEFLGLLFRYSATHYKPESIRRFAALIRKYAEWILEDNK